MHRWLVLLAMFAVVFSAAAEELDSRIALEELQSFVKVFEQVRQAYVDELDDKQLFEMAIRGMLSELDPHSDFLTRAAQNELRDVAEGRFSGIGVELSMQGDNLTVVSAIDGGPAARAGMQPGDVIRSIDGLPIDDLSFRQSLRLMEGEAGEPLKLEVSRIGERQSIELELVRERVTLATVSSRVVAEDIGYLRISQFSDQTGSEFVEQLDQLLQNSPWLVGLVVDLRNNPGGLMRAGVEVADTLLAEGLILTTKGRIEAANASFFASANQLAEELPVVVLVNQGSASASEIVAGAWQDNNRALILGDVTFGKGSVQEVLEIDERQAVKLTIARYYTPSGRSIQAQGIYPDLRIDQGTTRWQAIDGGFSEADMFQALVNDTDVQGMQVAGMRESISDIEDAQLSHAVTMLQGAALLKTPQPQ